MDKTGQQVLADHGPTCNHPAWCERDGGDPQAAFVAQEANCRCQMHMEAHPIGSEGCLYTGEEAVPLTPEEEARVRQRSRDWATADWGPTPDYHFHNHPETECQADRDVARLLATLDAARSVVPDRASEGRVDMLATQLQETGAAAVYEGDELAALAAVKAIGSPAWSVVLRDLPATPDTAVPDRERLEAAFDDRTMRDIPMPWYDESNPDYAEARNYIVDKIIAAPATPDTAVPEEAPDA